MQVLSYASISSLLVGVVLFLAVTVLPRSESATADFDRQAGQVSSAQVQSPGTRQRFSVTIRPAPRPRRVATGERDHYGQPVTLECRACHQIRSANRETRTAGALDEFHQGLSFVHGSLACVACHDERDGYTSLHLADGAAIPFVDSIRLCAQCHGSQFRDFQHGSHGGMTGYWDLSRGGRSRNHCQHCHDPHAPAYPVVYPVAGPRDRFTPATQATTHE